MEEPLNCYCFNVCRQNWWQTNKFNMSTSYSAITLWQQTILTIASDPWLRSILALITTSNGFIMNWTNKNKTTQKLCWSVVWREWIERRFHPFLEESHRNAHFSLFWRAAHTFGTIVTHLWNMRLCFEINSRGLGECLLIIFFKCPTLEIEFWFVNSLFCMSEVRSCNFHCVYKRAEQRRSRSK